MRWPWPWSWEGRSSRRLGLGLTTGGPGGPGGEVFFFFAALRRSHPMIMPPTPSLLLTTRPGGTRRTTPRRDCSSNQTTCAADHYCPSAFPPAGPLRHHDHARRDAHHRARRAAAGPGRAHGQDAQGALLRPPIGHRGCRAGLRGGAACRKCPLWSGRARQTSLDTTVRLALGCCSPDSTGTAEPLGCLSATPSRPRGRYYQGAHVARFNTQEAATQAEADTLALLTAQAAWTHAGGKGEMPTKAVA